MQKKGKGGKDMEKCLGKVKVGVVGYGVIGQRLADAVALQKDMELIGVADVAPTISVRALKAKGMPYRMFNVEPNNKSMEVAGIKISGTFEELVQEADIILDSSPGGVGEKNRHMYLKYNKKAIFQGGEKNEIANVFFHGYANYEKGIGQQFLKLTSCNTTGLIRIVDMLDREVGVKKVAITIIRRVADPGDYHRGLTNALQVEKAPSHQAIDLMTIMPHIPCTGILIHTPVTHGHIITVNVTPKKKLKKEDIWEMANNHPRIMPIKLSEGFLGNASLFRWARDKGNPRGDMYEIALWEESIVASGEDMMFAINIPQESVVIPESIDAIRASMKMQLTREEGTFETNKYLGMV